MISKRRRRRRGPSVAGTTLLLIVVVVVVVLLVHSRYARSGGSSDSGGPNAGLTTVPSAPAAAAAGDWKLVQLPRSGTGQLVSVITGARYTLDMTMYELQDPQVEAALVADAHRGVRVRVILNAAYSGTSENASAYRQLHAGGVSVKWGPSGTIVHQKTITADAGEPTALAAVGTGNLQQQYYSTTLDAWVLDTDAAQIDAIDATFASDWAAMPARLGTAVSAAGIVWSPGDQGTLVAAIDAAKTEVQFSSEELSDQAVIAALASRAQAGVACQILMTTQSEYESAMSQLAGDGCSVRTYPDTSTALYIHEKQIIVDGSELVIGSQNASVASLDYDRELSVVLTKSTAPAVLASAESDYASVFSGATPWQ